MHKFFIVGLGGSGGKTLQFLMDQLRSELRRREWKGEHLPRCWQFVHVDVPAQPDGIGDGLPPTVPQQGGRYLPVTTPNDRYQQLDAGLEQALAQDSVKQLRQLARWRPDAAQVNTPITKGAGQYRAIGRLATLARAREIFTGLRDAAQTLNSGEAFEDFSELQKCLGNRYAPPQDTMVIVISSLAGGTGASMTLDVCNLLRGVQQSVPNFPGEDAIAYLYTPDVFGRLDESARSGVNANALGTIAELMNARAAAQRPWTKADWDVYRVGQQPPSAGRGPRAVFPVGATNGISGAVFGDGQATTIYRGFARSLASMVLSEAQQTQVLSYVVTNFGNTEALPDSSDLAWAPGGGRDALGFGAIGFASIGLGRERYAEYVAQRLARQAVNRLLRGHVDASVREGRRTELEARNQYAADNYPQLLKWANLPPTPPWDEYAPLRQWVGDVWPDESQRAMVEGQLVQLVNEAAPPGTRQKTGRYAQQLGAAIPRVHRFVASEADRLIRQDAAGWVPRIQSRIEAAVLHAVARWGLPVTRRMVEQLEAELRQWANWLRARSQPATSPDHLVNDVLTPLYATDGVIDPSHALLQQARGAVGDALEDVAARTAAAVVADLVYGLAGEVVRGIAVGLADVERSLADAESRQAVDQTVSSVRTSVVQAWPQGDLVPRRFATATNEVLLERIDTYPVRFLEHVYLTFEGTPMPSGGRPTREQALDRAVEEIITFLRYDASGQYPTPVEHLTAWNSDDHSPVKLGRRGSWWPRMLASAAPTQTAVYEPALTAAALLEGARQWVGRPGQPLQGFVRQGLRSFLEEGADGPQARQTREEDFATRFRSALQLAAPLVGVDPTMVQAIHDQQVKVTYQFSAAPLRGAGAAVTRIRQEIEADPAIDSGPTLEQWERALGAEEANTDLPSVEIFGTYAYPYSPLVFTSLLGPIQEQWAQAISPQQRAAFWKWRRGRSLDEFIPVSPAWIQAFVTGWLVGRLTGEIRVPRATDADQRIRVWNDRGWVSFLEPLLGVQQLNRDLEGWGVPAAVVESLALALAKCNGDARLTALAPYVAVRRLGEELPLPGSAQHGALHSWIVLGKSRPGDRPQVREAAPQDTLDERLTSARDWLAALQAQMTERLLPTDRDGADLNGQFSQITRYNLGDVPREWEIAPQIVAGVDAILDELARPAYRPAAPAAPSVIDVEA